jgi:hypothetical protein
MIEIVERIGLIEVILEGTVLAERELIRYVEELLVQP